MAMAELGFLKATERGKDKERNVLLQLDLRSIWDWQSVHSTTYLDRLTELKSLLKLSNVWAFQGVAVVQKKVKSRRFCSNLGMTNQAVKAAQEAVQKSEELDIRRSPISVAAAIIYMITQLSDDKKLLKDISGYWCGRRDSQKLIQGPLSLYVKDHTAEVEDLRNLCSP
ncbi:hypothetical protein EZV62_001846 [Acer yangbiense]|uniref:Transcription factor TFIIB cyclin-like domain-containing protein n=1 Tax=Acer yangbiense TaxID=1000413 RepID=A0A5C7IVB5_9ROSI|nr:hypothetical protein EZV62_001846 [Acer yangbiense]